MEMVAASKMRKAQERMQKARPYATKMRNVVAHLSEAHLEYRHPYTLERPAKRVGFIIVSTDRGLCGGLNVNLFRATIAAMHEWDRQGVAIDLTTIGNKGLMFFKRMGGNIISQAVHIGDTPGLTDLIGTIKVMLDAYTEARIDRLFLVHNDFVNTMTQRPLVEQLLPIHSIEPQAELKHYWDYLYEIGRAHV